MTSRQRRFLEVAERVHAEYGRVSDRLVALRLEVTETAARDMRRRLQAVGSWPFRCPGPPATLSGTEGLILEAAPLLLEKRIAVSDSALARHLGMPRGRVVRARNWLEVRGIWPYPKQVFREIPPPARSLIDRLDREGCDTTQIRAAIKARFGLDFARSAIRQHLLVKGPDGRRMLRRPRRRGTGTPYTEEQRAYIREKAGAGVAPSKIALLVRRRFGRTCSVDGVRHALGLPRQGRPKAKGQGPKLDRASFVQQAKAMIRAEWDDPKVARKRRRQLERERRVDRQGVPGPG